MKAKFVSRSRRGKRTIIAHDSEERIAHMDVKPDNIFESEKKIYKLRDWDERRRHV